MKLLIKLGGTLLDQPESRRRLAAEMGGLAKEGHETVVVHGGGKQLSRYLQMGSFASEFRRGLRVTPPEILDAVLRIFTGEVNHHLVAELQRAGARAVGLSGIDAGLVEAVPLGDDLGAVGKVDRVDASILDLLTTRGYVPAVACVAGGRDGAIYNVNADQMAVACAAAFSADQLVFLTDVEGVLDAGQKLIARLTAGEIENLIETGIASGGMEVKLRAAAGGVQHGIGKVRIAAGKQPNILSRLLQGETLGTTLVAA